jgi:hypothetical protein
MNRQTRIIYCLPLCLIATAACNDQTPPGEPAESVTSALIHTTTGNLKPFGGLTPLGSPNKCIAVVGDRLEIATCSTNHAQNFTLALGDELVTSVGLCVDIENGDLGAGVVHVWSCNHTDNQKWTFDRGQIISKNHGNSGLESYCLDVYYGNEAVGTRLGVAPCNGTGAQLFWMTGYTQDIKSSYSVPTGPGTCARECLDVAYDVEMAGTGLVNFNCNGTNAQWFFFDKNQRIHLANADHLCVALNGPIQNDLAPVALTTCTQLAFDFNQAWYFRNVPGGMVIKNMAGDVCLDVQNGVPTPATPVVAYKCNQDGADAQRWSPRFDVPTCP